MYRYSARDSGQCSGLQIMDLAALMSCVAPAQPRARAEDGAGCQRSDDDAD